MDHHDKVEQDDNMNNYQAMNEQLLSLLSNYLNHYSDFIKEEVVHEIMQDCSVSSQYAFAVLLAAAFELDMENSKEDSVLFHEYLIPMLEELDTVEYKNNEYYKNILFPNKLHGNWEFRYESYKPYEAFVYNDFEQMTDGRLLPKIGYFPHKFVYPAILENDRIWMTITPNEIETMKEPIEEAFGNVLTFGMGLGYFPYMISLKSSVKSITIVERSYDVIDLFRTHILPQFKDPSIVTIIQSDAFDYASANFGGKDYDYIYTDLWHDVSDGIDLYLKMKEYEYLSPKSKFSYWIERSILCYM